MGFQLPDSIKNKKEAISYLNQLKVNGMMYCIDDDAESVIWADGREYSAEYLAKMNELKDQMFSIEGFNPWNHV